MNVKAFFSSLAVSVGLTVGMLLLTALLMYKMGLSGVWVNVCVAVTYIASNFSGGFIFGKCMEKRRFLWGLLLATAYFVLYFICGMLVPDGGSIGLGNLFVTYAIMAGSGMLGGMLAG